MNKDFSAQATPPETLPTPADYVQATLGLHAATVALLAEAQALGYRFYALHLRVALMELETQMGGAAEPGIKPPLSSLPRSARRKPKISKALQQLIRLTD